MEWIERVFLAIDESMVSGDSREREKIARTMVFVAGIALVMAVFVAFGFGDATANMSGVGRFVTATWALVGVAFCAVTFYRTRLVDGDPRIRGVIQWQARLFAAMTGIFPIMAIVVFSG